MMIPQCATWSVTAVYRVFIINEYSCFASQKNIHRRDAKSSKENIKKYNH